ncbi:MAG: response regulator [Polyangiaceae bacterium]
MNAHMSTGSASQAKTILIADDESLFRQSAADSLRARFRGATVLEAEDGGAALDIMASSQVDVLVTDLHMPEADGLTLVAWIASHRVPIQVIVTTAHGSDQTRKSLSDLGALVCLDKPIDLRTLHEAVDRMLATPRAHLGGVTLTGFVQLLEAEKRTCALRVKASTGAGTLVFHRGVIVDAWNQSQEGDDAALTILGLRDCTLDVVGSMPAQARRVTRPLSFLLLESARLADEAEREAHDAAQSEKLHNSLRALLEIDGATGAAFVDSGTENVLARASSTPDADLEAAAAGHAPLVRAMRNLTVPLGLTEGPNDLQITTDTACVFLWPLEEGPAPRFLYIKIDRKGGNPVLARLRIAKIAASIELEPPRPPPVPSILPPEW